MQGGELRLIAAGKIHYKSRVVYHLAKHSQFLSTAQHKPKSNVRFIAHASHIPFALQSLHDYYWYIYISPLISK